MKTMYPPGYHYNGFVATYALGHMMYAHLTFVSRGSLMITNDQYIYIYIYIYIDIIYINRKLKSLPKVYRKWVKIRNTLL